MSVSISVKVGRKTGEPMKQEEMDVIIKEHEKWLEKKDEGNRADLREANLEGLDMHDADLSFADFSGAWMSGVNLRGTNLTGACLRECDFGHNADLKGAVLNDANLIVATAVHANFARTSMRNVQMQDAVLWDSCFKNADLTGANMYGADLADCIMTNADLSYAYLFLADLDNTVFKNAILKNAVIIYAPYMEYTDLTGADFTGAVVTDCTFADEAANAAKGLNRHMLCPEEGSFIAWKKCREDRIVKLLVPENALRTGGFHDAIRASEVNVLDIIGPDGEHKGSAVSLSDESLIYNVGETVKIPENEFDGSLWHEGAGIYFFLTREEAERFEYKKNDEGKNENEDE